MKRIIAIGGGELRNFSTLTVDEFIVNLIKTPEKRLLAVFVPTASHDSKPYFNTFRKTYTSKLGCKVDVALLSRDEMSFEHIVEKLDKADIIYVGGGDTAFLLDEWRKSGLDKVLIREYERGAVLCGLSAGAICWFEKAHSDYMIMENGSGDYSVLDGLGLLKGVCVPHYDEADRLGSWEKMKEAFPLGLCIENNCGVYFEDGVMQYSVGEGNAYLYENGVKKLVEKRTENA